MKKIVLAGGSGYLGQCIIRYFDNADTEFVVLSRYPEKTSRPNVRYVTWNAKAINGWQKELEGADAVINLTGKSVNCRYTTLNKQQILNSRVDSTNAIGIAINRCQVPPAVWINASSLAIYGNTADSIVTENTPLADGFSAQVCRQWEDACNDLITPLTRKVILRTGIVLGSYGGAAPYYKTLAALGLGGRQGSGQQYISWLHEEDFVRCIQFVLQNQQLEGTFNCTAPIPVTNAEFNTTVRKTEGISTHFNLSSVVIKAGALLIGTAPELILNGRRAIPEKLMAAGFVFKYNNLQETLRQLYGNKAAASVKWQMVAWWLVLCFFIIAGPALAFTGEYGYALFVTVPICLGYSYSMLRGLHGKKRLGQLILGTSILGLIACLFFLVVGVEGLICVVMALPIVIPLMILGTLLAYAIQKRLWAKVYTPVLLLMLNPLSLVYDVTYNNYRTSTVTTQMVVNAPAQVVWQQIASPFNFGKADFFWLKRGISYPENMSVVGKGDSMFLQCHYSNGNLLAPVLVYQPNSTLRFKLTEPPVSMRETSFYPGIQPQHVSSKFFVEYGEFKIIATGSNQCIVNATTAYQYKIGPEAYWELWSNFLIDKMHLHVLHKIKAQSEAH